MILFIFTLSDINKFEYNERHKFWMYNSQDCEFFIRGDSDSISPQCLLVAKDVIENLSDYTTRAIASLEEFLKLKDDWQLSLIDIGNCQYKGDEDFYLMFSYMGGDDIFLNAYTHYGVSFDSHIIRDYHPGTKITKIEIRFG